MADGGWVAGNAEDVIIHRGALEVGLTPTEKPLAADEILHRIARAFDGY
jgi:hypothetical protein